MSVVIEVVAAIYGASLSLIGLSLLGTKLSRRVEAALFVETSSVPAELELVRAAHRRVTRQKRFVGADNAN